MLAVLAQLDRVLRGDDRAVGRRRPGLRLLLAGATAAAVTYGAAMGTFGLAGGFERSLQMAYSAVKVPMLLVVTFGLCLPSFFVANTLAGLRDDFAEALRALLSAQCALALVLLSLAPFTAVWYLSDASYDRALLFNAAMFGISSVAAQRVLNREYRGLIAKNPRHRLMIRLWLGMYAFVGIQMGWVLRPFVGNPALPVRFFREGAWGNAYQEVLQIVWRQVAG